MSHNITKEEARKALCLPNVKPWHYYSGICPICGDAIIVTESLENNENYIGSCGDSFTKSQWETRNRPFG